MTKSTYGMPKDGTGWTNQPPAGHDEVPLQGIPVGLPRAAQSTRRNILEAAMIAVHNHGAEYDTPENNFQRAADIATVILGDKLKGDYRVSAVDVALLLAGVKMARLIHDPANMDSWADLAGYAACGGEVA